MARACSTPRAEAESSRRSSLPDGGGPWDEALAATGLFRLVQYFRFDWDWLRSEDEIVGLASSLSYVRNVLDGEKWLSFEGQLRETARRHTDATGHALLKMRTDLYVAR